jgi:hypothetical protein
MSPIPGPAPPHPCRAASPAPAAPFQLLRHAQSASPTSSAPCSTPLPSALLAQPNPQPQPELPRSRSVQRLASLPTSAAAWLPAGGPARGFRRFPPCLTLRGTRPPTPTSCAVRLPTRLRPSRQHPVTLHVASSDPPLLCLWGAPTTSSAPPIASMPGGMGLYAMPRLRLLSNCVSLRSTAPHPGRLRAGLDPCTRTQLEKEGPDRSQSTKSLWRSTFNTACSGRTTMPDSMQLCSPNTPSSARRRGSASATWLGTTAPEIQFVASSASVLATNKAAVARVIPNHSTTVRLRSTTDAVLPFAPTRGGLTVPPRQLPPRQPAMSRSTTTKGT